MKAATVLLALFTAVGMAAPTDVAGDVSNGGSIIEARQANLGGIPPSPNGPIGRAVLLQQSHNRLQQLRDNAANEIRNGRGRGRRLAEGPCGPLCTRCMDSSTRLAIIEVAACGAAALGIEAVSGPLATFAAVTLFTSCEALAVESLNHNQSQCLAIGGQ